MLAQFRNLKIGTRIAVAIMIPVLGLMAFAGSAVTDRYVTAGAMASLDRAVELTDPLRD